MSRTRTEHGLHATAKRGGRYMGMLGSLCRASLNLIAPPRCPGCDHVQPAGGFCGGCQPLLESALPVAGPDRAGLRHQGPLADALHRFKYRERSDLAGALVAALPPQVLPDPAAYDGLVPIPLHRSRLRQRGYNQSALLAAHLAGAIGLKVRHDVLRRARPTRPQVGLSKRQRVANVDKAFVARPAARGGRWLLVDDVRTSGATLNEARRTLLAAGAHWVSGLALAQAHEDGTTGM